MMRGNCTICRLLRISTTVIALVGCNRLLVMIYIPLIMMYTIVHNVYNCNLNHSIHLISSIHLIERYN